ncbi:unnamed protein product [Angiostrongylus costaricensis]|uniref:Splicing factor, arginine/serine-rich 1 n=1 Tax=Angiostrongylus costaricensis TaxID=334426 RepID=A0A0R3PCN5_ANGCS|nr:unnamed protein product [Angiostrongylus costaricensis]
MGREDTRIYVGNLPPDCREKDIEDVFAKYGKIRSVDIKGGRGPLYAFVEFEDSRDASDAVRSRDGYDLDGSRLRVEFTRGSGPRGSGGRSGRGGYGGRGGGYGGRGGGYGGYGGYGGHGRDYGNNRRDGGGSRRSNYRVIVEGLPTSGSWQDLKDHMREAGEVCYANVARDGTGVVEFTRFDDMKEALRKLDDTKFRSHEGETGYIRVREDTSNNGGGGGGSGGGGRGRSRSRSRSPRRSSPKYSPRSHSSSRSTSRTPSRSRSRSRD